MLIFNKVTTAQTSMPFKVAQGRTPSIKSTGLAGAEVINLMCEINGQFVAATDSSGAAIQFTATSPNRTINADGIYQAVLPANPASAVTLQLG